MPTKLSWTPVRRGAIYCAPACGRGCTFAEYQHAVKSGKKLAATLGTGWTSSVSENLGWFYEATSPCGRMRVSPLEDRRGKLGPPKVLIYHADLGGMVDDSPGQWIGEGGTPTEAVRDAVRKAYTSLKRLQDFLKPLPKGGTSLADWVAETADRRLLR